MPEDQSSDTTIIVRHAPTFYVIIAMKLLKGLSFAALALWLYVMSDNNLPDEYQHAMLTLHAKLHVNPETKFWMGVADKVGTLTETKMLRAALGTLIYSLFALVEGVGLMFRSRWIGWLSIGESAFFIPIEVFELVNKNFNWIVFLVLVVNVFMLWYLFQNRERLFRHHRHHH